MLKRYILELYITEKEGTWSFLDKLNSLIEHRYLIKSLIMEVDNKKKISINADWSQDHQRKQQNRKTDNAGNQELFKRRLGVLSWYLLFCIFPLESILWLLASLPIIDPVDVSGLVIFLVTNICIQVFLLGADRLAYQRGLIAYLRRALLGDKCQIFTSLTVDAWETQKAYIVLPSLLVPGGFVLFISDVLRGRFTLAFAQLRITVYLCAALYLRTETAVRVFVSLHVPYQVCNLWLLPNASAILRRSLSIRILVSSLSVEGLDEILLHCLPLMIWSKHYLLIFSMIALVVFPLELLGFRVLFAERIRRAMIVGWPVSVRTVFPLRGFVADSGTSSQQLPSPSSRSSRLMFFSVTSVPMAVMGMSFTSGFPQINHPQNLLRLIIIQCAFAAMQVILGLLLGSRVDDFIQPTFLKQRIKFQETQDNDNHNINSVGPPISKDVNALMVCAWSLTCFVSFMRFETGLVVFVVAASTWAMVALYMKEQKNSITFRKLRRRLLIASHVALFLVCDPSAQPNMPIILALARALFVLDESATVSELAVELGLGSLLQIRGLMNSPPYTVFSVFLISICSTLLSLASAAATESRCRLCEAVRKSENFLDHAIKQKYSGVGATLEGILEDERVLKIMESESTLNKGVSDLFDLLKSALHACHAGRDICHMSASVRKALVDPARMDGFPVAIATILTDWKENGVFDSIHVHDTIAKVNRVQLRVDRDLLRALLCNLAGDPRQATLEVSIFDTTTIMHSPLQRDSEVASRLQNSTYQKIGVQFKIVTREANLVSPSGNKSANILSGLGFSDRTLESREYLVRLRGDVATLLGGVLADDKSIAFGENLVKPDSPHPRSVQLAQHLSPRFFSPKLQIVTISEISNRGLTPYVKEAGSVQKPVFPEENEQTYSRPLSAVTVRQTHSLQPMGKFRTGAGLVPNLTFAILDDNALVRKNVLRLVMQHALADRDSSFASGKTLEETLFFPHLISSKKVHVAIIDENLEYDSAASVSGNGNSGSNHHTAANTNGEKGFVISGTEIGRRARLRGFQGCLILHSANGELASHLPTEFDGFIEKTSRKDEFIHGIEHAWMKFIERRHPVPNS